MLALINHGPTAAAVDAERALLSELDGSCRTPIAGLAEVDDEGILTLRALVAKPDGSAAHTTSRRGQAADAAALGADAGRELRCLAGPGFLDDVG
jgi:hydroxymethylbilane synthase